MASTRPYLITHAGLARMIEARNPEHAAYLALGHLIEVRAAGGADVLAWQRAGKKLENAEDMMTAEEITGGTPGPEYPRDSVLVAGVNIGPIPAGTRSVTIDVAGQIASFAMAGLDPDGKLSIRFDTDPMIAKLTTAEAAQWLHENGGGIRAGDAWHDAESSGLVSVETFDIISANCTAFRDMLIRNRMGYGRDDGFDPDDVDQLRAELAQNAMPFSEVLLLIEAEVDGTAA